MRLKTAGNTSHAFDIEQECIEYPLLQWVDAPGSKLNVTHYPRILVELGKMTLRRLLG